MSTVCKAIIVLALLTRLASSTDCLTGYTLNNGICYDFRNTAYITRATCFSNCASAGAMMLCIQDSAQQGYIYSHVSSGAAAWIGLQWSETWNWQSGCTSTYFNWMTNGEGTQNEEFAMISSWYGGMWSDVGGSYSDVTQCFCQHAAFFPTAAPTAQPSKTPTSQPTTQPSRQPTSHPSIQPSAHPSAQPTGQPSVQPTSVAMLKSLSSKSYKTHNGFSFAARTSSGAVLYWAGDGTMDVHGVVAAGSLGAAVNRAAVAALTSAGYVEVAGIPAYARGYDAFQANGISLVSVVGNDGAFAGLTSASAAVAFGGQGNGNDVSTSGFAAQLISGVVAIVASAASFTALKADGTVFTWGSKYCGGGVSSLTRTDLQGIVKVFATRTAFAGLTFTGQVKTWGDQHDGGDSSAVSAQLQSGVYHIISTQSAFVAFKKDGSIAVWGNSWYGTDTTDVATQIATGVVFVTHTSSAFAALKADGSVVTWGKAEYGGDSSAVQAALVGITTIVSNLYAFAAITGTGAVVTWGDAPEGGEIPADLVAALSSGVTEAFSTNRAFAALKGATGELVVWGNPYHGGDAGAAAAYLTSGVRTVCGNDAAFTAILQDGRAVAWGHGSSVPQPGLLNTQGASMGEINACV